MYMTSVAPGSVVTQRFWGYPSYMHACGAQQKFDMSFFIFICNGGWVEALSHHARQAGKEIKSILPSTQSAETIHQNVNCRM